MLRCVLGICFLFFIQSHAWDNEEFELFDLVEELNQNFYDFIGVTSSASSAEIRKAYRRRSLEEHPDRSKQEDAETRFRHLTAVYEVLKDPARRQQYDHVLEFGLPDWRQPVYYYRKVRRMGLVEIGLLLLVIFTVGHFLVIWAAYLERRFEMEEVFRSRRKKERKASKRNKGAAASELDEQEMLDDILTTISRPALTDLLPLKCVRGLCGLFLGIGHALREVHEARKLRALEQQQQLEEESEDEAEEVRWRRRRADLHMEKAPEMAKPGAPVLYSTPAPHSAQQSDGHHKQKQVAGDRPWTTEDDHLLAKAVAKFPGGTLQRWEKISDMLDRPVSQVISKAKAISRDYSRAVDVAAQGITGKDSDSAISQKNKHLEQTEITTRSDSLLPETVARRRIKSTKVTNSADRTLLISAQKPENLTSSTTQNESTSQSTKLVNGAAAKNERISSDSAVNNSSKGATKTDNEGEVWSQNQQKIFEWSLSQYPKGTPERWDKIAAEIAGKTKEDCVARFRFLASVVQKKKQQQKASS